MDIIALGKANKAKRAIKKVNDRLGTNVALSFGSVKKRIEFLETKVPQGGSLDRISALEANTTINLNKHNLRVETLMNKSRYALTDSIVDDFDDATGIDAAKSTGYKHDAATSSILQNDVGVPATVITVKETATTDPTWISISAVTSTNPDRKLAIDLTKGVLDNLVLTTGTLSVLKTGTQFAKQGTWTSNVIDMTAEMVSMTKIAFTSTIPTNASVLIETAGSNDGVTFGAFTALDATGNILTGNGRYLKIRLTLKSVETSTAAAIVYDFIASEQAQYQSTAGVILDGSLKLASTFDTSMTVLSQPAEGGTILSVPFNINDYQAFEKIEIV